jgi:hypothetical protein
MSPAGEAWASPEQYHSLGRCCPGPWPPPPTAALACRRGGFFMGAGASRGEHRRLSRAWPSPCGPLPGT